MAIFGILTRAERRDRDYAAHVAGYDAARDEAVTGLTCFCICGCRLPVVELAPVTGGPVRCDECRAQSQRDGHKLIRPPVETFDWAKYEDPEPPKQPRPLVSPLALHEAESYVRKRGRRGFKTLERLHARLVEGRSLTDAQAYSALRSKAADMRAEFRASEDAAAASWRARKHIDLNRIVIPETLLDGSYAVRDDSGGFVRIDIKRPKRGRMRGFVRVAVHFGESVVQHGLQFPQPYKPTPGYAQTYRGASAHLVAQLVGNPEQARADFKQAATEAA